MDSIIRKLHRNKISISLAWWRAIRQYACVSYSHMNEPKCKHIKKQKVTCETKQSNVHRRNVHIGLSLRFIAHFYMMNCCSFSSKSNWLYFRLKFNCQIENEYSWLIQIKVIDGLPLSCTVRIAKKTKQKKKHLRQLSPVIRWE